MCDYVYERSDVAKGVEEDALCVLSNAADTACFLKVPGHAWRNRIMNDEIDELIVDTLAKGASAHENRDEPRLQLLYDVG